MKNLLLGVFLGVVCLLAATTATTANLSGNAASTVNFEFDGLGIFAFGDASRASLGLLDVVHHTPNIQIKTLKKGKVVSTNVITAQQLKAKVIDISVPNNRSAPTRYYSSDMARDKSDFRWTLDLESDLFQKQLYLKDNFFAKIHFTTGTFTAANITDEKFTFTAGSKIHSFNRQIGQPAATISLQPSQSLIISGLDKPITLPYQQGVDYSVSITNLPPNDMANIDHFLFYYDAIKSAVPRFVPVQVKKVSLRPYPMVCEMVVMGKSSI